jgi:hypothetical protein
MSSPKPPNPFKQNKIELQVSYPQIAIIKTVEKNKTSPAGIDPPSGANSFQCNILDATHVLSIFYRGKYPLRTSKDKI